MEKIRFGICARPDQVAAAAKAGYDYIELNLNDVMTMDEIQYRAMASEMQAHGIYAEVVCGMLPEGMEIVGEAVSTRRLHESLERSFDLAQALGAEIIIFDCEKSRSLPLNFDPAMAWRQLGNFIRILQGHAADFDLKVALLPLRRSAADLMNYITEATLISAMLRLDRVGVAASAYNMAMEAESLPQLRRTGSLLWHMRMSNVLGNRPPREGDGEDYASYFRTLREMGYCARVSCEAPCTDFEKDADQSLRVLKSALESI